MENQFIKQRLEKLKELQTPSGLFLAAKCEDTGYDKVWLRDNFYVALAFQEAGDFETVNQIYHGLLDIMLKHEEKIDWAINNKLEQTWQYIHARYDPNTLCEIFDEWGNKQNDAIGGILFGIGTLEQSGHSVIRDDNDQRIIEKLVRYLASIEYWKCEDNGMWEEYPELHASSVGACMMGLNEINNSDIMRVDSWLIENGRLAMEKDLLPRESKSKFLDMALLSLIYPYDSIDERNIKSYIKYLEYFLMKGRGMIRYKGDRYYNTDTHGGKEAEWTMGAPWLSICYGMIGDNVNALKYLNLSDSLLYNDMMPELYYSGEDRPNGNVSLAWAEAMYIIANIRMYEKEKLLSTSSSSKEKS
jgi:phosphorylase kinase alpha/beta subunit